jgi:hypothetical protein
MMLTMVVIQVWKITCIFREKNGGEKIEGQNMENTEM